MKNVSKKRSVIWEYFNIDPEDEKNAICNTCDEAVSRGGASAKNFNTSNLQYHLKQEHRVKFDELEVKEAERNDQREAEQDTKRRKADVRQLTLNKVKENKDAWTYDHPQHKKITNWIAEMMALDSQPFSIVEDAGFLRLLTNVRPRYVMPSRKYFSEKIIPRIFSTIKTKLHEEIHSYGGKFPVSFTTDIWTRKAGGDSLISWTAHFINPESFTREERILQVCPFPGSHTAEAISETITKLLDSWSIEKSRVHVVVRDNAANMVAGIEQSDLPAIGCTIHTLQLVIKDCIMTQRAVIDMLARCRKIVGHFKHSHLAVERLNSIQKQLNLPEHKLVQDEPTRWDSTYYLLDRLVEQRRAISFYDTDFELPEKLNSNEWQLAEKVVKLLEPMQRITKELSAKRAVISEVIPFLEILKSELNEESGDTQKKFRGILSTKEELLESLKSRFSHVYKEDNYIIATLLDPRFKASFFDSATSELAVQRLIAVCRTEPTLVLNERDNTQPCLAQLQVHNCDISEQPTEPSATNPSSLPLKKKGFNIYDSYKKANKKLAPASSTPAADIEESLSAMVTDYISGPVIDNPEDKKFMNPFDYWRKIKNITLC